MRLFVFAIACLAASPAFAGKPKVAVHPVTVIGPGVRKDAAAQMTKAIIDELRSADLGAVLAEESARVLPVPAKATKSAVAGEGDVAEARRELARMHIPKAIALLEGALRGMSADVAAVADHGRFVEAELLLAEAYYRQGSEAQGRKAFEAVVRWAPDTVVDSKRFPPVFVRAFEDVRSSVVAGPRGSVSVTSSPEGQRVVFNGKVVGVTPLVIDDVVPGENHVVLRGDEPSTGMLVRVEPRRTADARLISGDAATVTAAGGVRAGIAANTFDTQERLAGLQLGSSVSADLVILLGIAEGDRLYQVGGFIGSTKMGRWAPLPLLQVDADMLSASIEGGKLARVVALQAKAFKATAIDGTLPFIKGLATMEPVAARGMTSAGHVSFVPVAAVAAVAPVAAVSPVAPVAPTPPPAPITEDRGPVAEDRRPIADDRDPGSGIRAPIADERRNDRLLTRSVASQNLERDSATAASLAAIDGYSPMTDRNAVAVGQSYERDSVTGKWWFWAAVGVGAAVIGGTTYYLVTHNQHANTVSVQAAW